MNEALTGLVVAALVGLGSLIVMLGRVLTAYLRVKEARYERMLARRGLELEAPPVVRRRKRRSLAEKIFDPRDVLLELERKRQPHDTDPDEK